MGLQTAPTWGGPTQKEPWLSKGRSIHSQSQQELCLLQRRLSRGSEKQLDPLHVDFFFAGGPTSALASSRPSCWQPPLQRALLHFHIEPEQHLVTTPEAGRPLSYLTIVGSSIGGFLLLLLFNFFNEKPSQNKLGR